MSLLRTALVSCLLMAIASFTEAREEKGKIDKAKLVGTWTFVKTNSKDAPPPGASIKIDFTRDGKLTMSLAFMDRSVKYAGTYTVAGDQLTTILKAPDGKEKKETVTITVLTDKKFVTTEKEDGKTVTSEFKK